MKELTLEEVLRIAGGVPTLSALDELTYRVHEANVRDPVEEARVSQSPLCTSKPD
jgi:hypothetical protein